MWINALESLSFWLTYISLYSFVVEGSEKLQNGISAFFDDFVSGANGISPQEMSRLRHSPKLHKLKTQLNSNRLSVLRSFFNLHPSAYFS